MSQNIIELIDENVNEYNNNNIVLIDEIDKEEEINYIANDLTNIINNFDNDILFNKLTINKLDSLDNNFFRNFINLNENDNDCYNTVSNLFGELYSDLNINYLINITSDEEKEKNMMDTKNDSFENTDNNLKAKTPIEKDLDFLISYSETLLNILFNGKIRNVNIYYALFYLYFYICSYPEVDEQYINYVTFYSVLLKYFPVTLSVELDDENKYFQNNVFNLLDDILTGRSDENYIFEKFYDLIGLDEMPELPSAFSEVKAYSRMPTPQPEYSGSEWATSEDEGKYESEDEDVIGNQVNVAEGLKKIPPYTSPEELGKRKREEDDEDYKNMKGGSCEYKTNKMSLMALKFLFEWDHDFGPHRAMDATISYGAPNFYDPNNIFNIIQNQWREQVEQWSNKENNNINTSIDKELFDALNGANKHDEPTYISLVVNNLVKYCSDQISDYLYIPVVTIKWKKSEEYDINQFLSDVNKYYGGKRMFVKIDDELSEEIHLFITSDMTPTNDIPPNQLGFYMEDMSVENLPVALCYGRRGLYEVFDQTINSQGNNLNSIEFFSDMQKNAQFKETLEVTKDDNKQLETPAKLIDPITRGSFNLINGNISINDNNINDEQKSVLNVGIKTATIYAINNLFYFWGNVKNSIVDYTLLEQGDNKTNGIEFITQDNQNLTWVSGESTVNFICGAIINYYKTKNVNSDIYRNIYNIAGYLCNSNDTNPNDYPKIFITVLSFLKSCGDEMQRLTCECMNFMVENKNIEHIIEFLPETIEGVPVTGDKLKQLGEQLKGINDQKEIMFLSRDRVLIGKSLQDDTALLSFLQSPHDAFEEVADFYVNMNSVTLIKTGIMSNRKNSIMNVRPETIIANNNNQIDKLINRLINKLVVDNDTNYTTERQSLIGYLNSNNFEQNNDLLIEQQKIVIGILTGVILPFEYYDKNNNNNNNNNNITDFIIDSEINSSISKTINGDTINSIKLYNGRVPKSVKLIVNIIENAIGFGKANVYNDNHVISKLTEANIKAHELAQNKINYYNDLLNNIEENDQINNLQQDLQVLIQPFINICKNKKTEAQTIYSSCGEKIETKKNTFLEKLSSQIKTRYNLLVKSESKSRGTQKVDYSGKVSNLNDELYILNSNIKESEKKEMTFNEIKQQLEAKLRFNEQQLKEKKTQQPKMFIRDQIKQFKNTLKQTLKDAKETSKTLALLTSQKEKIEKDISVKAKIFTSENAKNLLNGISSFFNSKTSRGGKTRKNKRKHYKTKKHNKKNNKSCCRKTKNNRKNHLKKHNKTKIKK